MPGEHRFDPDRPGAARSAAGRGGATRTRALASLPARPRRRVGGTRVSRDPPRPSGRGGDRYRLVGGSSRPVDSAPATCARGGRPWERAPAHPAGRGRGTHTCRWIAGRQPAATCVRHLGGGGNGFRGARDRSHPADREAPAGRAGHPFVTSLSPFSRAAPRHVWLARDARSLRPVARVPQSRWTPTSPDRAALY